MNVNLPTGTAAIKSEFLLSFEPRPVADDDAAEGSGSRANGTARQNDGRDSGPSGRGKWSKEKKKAQRGANKGRRFGKIRDELELCWRVANGETCEYGSECRFTHDIDAYLAAKPRDIHFPSSKLTNEPPYVLDCPDREEPGDDRTSLDTTTLCPCYEETGQCRLGLKCRFLGAHVRKDENGVVQLITDEEKRTMTAISHHELNFVDNEMLKLLRSRKYPRPVTDAYLKELQSAENAIDQAGGQIPAEDEPIATADPVEIEESDVSGITQKRTGGALGQTDGSDVPTRFMEKKRLQWSGKTYLAPLTTVGNLPFRRLCVSLGADITCGEMGLATSFLSGSKEEWSLVRRHPSETMFGVQIAGNKPASMVPAAEILAREFPGTVDFVDVNCGCPIDLVFRSGSGSALLDTTAKLGKILIGMSRALGEIPVTVKLRTGVKDGKNTAHKLMPRLAPEWGVSCVTLHGRTRQQRYTKLADWNYIKECVEAVRAREVDEDLPRIPIFGGGDCFSSSDYWEHVESSGVDGVMVGRGALIKPWIFTEIKERREWDISSRERLELVKKYAEYGLSHFGTDTAGVNTTRRYLCEALSFHYRYVPIGILERLPSRINDRAPAFKGRDELETLLASGDSRDWVKISEMFLGPAPESWTFTPKHKSNAYGGEESQG